MTADGRRSVSVDIMTVVVVVVVDMLAVEVVGVVLVVLVASALQIRKPPVPALPLNPLLKYTFSVLSPISQLPGLACVHSPSMHPSIRLELFCSCVNHFTLPEALRYSVAAPLHSPLSIT